jgi:hypothetical protein
LVASEDPALPRLGCDAGFSSTCSTSGPERWPAVEPGDGNAESGIEHTMQITHKPPKSQMKAMLCLPACWLLLI